MSILDPQVYNHMSLHEIEGLIILARLQYLNDKSSASEKFKIVENELRELMSDRVEIHFIENQTAQMALEYLDQVIANEIQQGSVKLPSFKVEELGTTLENINDNNISDAKIIDFIKSHDATVIEYLDFNLRDRENHPSSQRREDLGYFLDLPEADVYAIPNNPTQFLFSRNKFRSLVGGMHAVLVTGFRTDARGNLAHIEVMQSWGPYMGIMGRHLISSDYLRKYGTKLIGIKKEEVDEGAR